MNDEVASYIEENFSNGEPTEEVIAYLEKNILPLTYEMSGR